MFFSLGRFLYRRRWLVLATWLVLILVGAVLGGSVFDRLVTSDNLRPDAESVRAERRLDQLLPEGPTVVAVIRDRDPYDPGLVASVTDVGAAIGQLPGVAEVEHLYNAPGGQIGADNRSTLIRVELAEGLPEAERERVEDRVIEQLRRVDAPEVLVGGEKLAERAFAEQAIRDATIGESIALGVLLIALVVILGGLVAGAIPLLAALGAVAVTLLGLLGLAAVTPVSEFAVNVVTLLGIGLAVDYALLLVMRFREERAALLAGKAAALAAGPADAPAGGSAAGGTLVDDPAELAELLGRTVAGAGRAVLVSGLAVGAAMAGLAAFAEPLLAAMAFGGALVVLVATLVGLTAVPALIAVAHRRIPPPGDGVGRSWWRRRRAPGSRWRRPVPVPGPGPADRGGLLARLAGHAQRRPGPVAAVVSGVLLLLAVPFLFGANLANSDARALPSTMEARRVYDVLLRDFQAGQAAPVTVVVDADPATGDVRDLMNQLNALPGVVQMKPRPDVPAGAAIIDLIPAGETVGRESREIVRRVRALDTSVPVLVGGAAAELVDYRSSVADRLPLALLVLLLVTGVLLFALTGSVVVPLKALAMNALTVLATLGVLVAVFQEGIGAALLGVEPWGAVDLTTPVLLFVFVFGLSMDYEVFLLARIREEWDRLPAGTAGASDRAVLTGITRTGPVVTAAAVCITIVFLGFLLGELTAVKEVGFGMAVAVLIDVTLIRGLLLPAVMSLLGDWNWWAPSPLRRFYDRYCRVSVSGHVGT